jgi:hypothetical protein
MKVKTDVLEDFLTKVRMDDSNTCLLRFEEEGLSVSILSPANTQKCDATLFKSNFVDYAPIGNIGVDELHRLIKVLKKLEKEVEIKVEGNLISFIGTKKEVSFELVDEKFIDEVKPTPAMEHPTSFAIQAELLSSFLSDAQTNTDVSVFFETVEGGVKLANDGKYQFKYNVDSEGTKAGEKVRFGQPLVATMAAIKKGELTVHIKSDYPVLIDHKTDNYKMQFMVAPRVDN